MEIRFGLILQMEVSEIGVPRPRRVGSVAKGGHFQGAGQATSELLFKGA